jgi:hypothetical protein
VGVKRPGREADHSPPSSIEVKECVELYLRSPIRFHGLTNLPLYSSATDMELCFRPLVLKMG